MKKLNTFALVVSKCLEVLHWLGTASMVLLLVCSVVIRDKVASLLARGIASQGTSLATYSFELEVAGTNGTISMAGLMLFCVAAIILLSLMAMVFRNVYLILKAYQKSSWQSPFQPDIIRMLREIGIFSISVPVVGFVFGIAARLILGPDATEVYLNADGLVMGLLVLCLTQVFTYGAELQKDVDGLV